MEEKPFAVVIEDQYGNFKAIAGPFVGKGWELRELAEIDCEDLNTAVAHLRAKAALADEMRDVLFVMGCVYEKGWRCNEIENDPSFTVKSSCPRCRMLKKYDSLGGV